MNGYFSGSNKAFRISHPPIFRMTSLLLFSVLNDLKCMESYESDIYRFRAYMTLKP